MKHVNCDAVRKYFLHPFLSYILSYFLTSSNSKFIHLKSFLGLQWNAPGRTHISKCTLILFLANKHIHRTWRMKLCVSAYCGEWNSVYLHTVENETLCICILLRLKLCVSHTVENETKCIHGMWGITQNLNISASSNFDVKQILRY
jgi:hypothetical protein